MSNESSTDAPFVKVLGIAQDGGYPHPGCHRDCCAAAWADSTLRKSVACLAVIDPHSQQRWLIDCTPDFPLQLHRSGSAKPILAEHNPCAASTSEISLQKSRPVEGIFLTHGHMGHYSGLMYLGREALDTQCVKVFAMPRLSEFLNCNEPWNQLIQAKNVEIRSLVAGGTVTLNERITVTPFLVPHRNEFSETVAFKIAGPKHSVLYAPDVDDWDACQPSIKQSLRLWMLRSSMERFIPTASCPAGTCRKFHTRRSSKASAFSRGSTRWIGQRFNSST